MRAKSALVSAVLGAVALCTGCTSCPRKAYAECLRPVEEMPATAQARARVNVFLMNGADLLDVGGLSELKESILSAGYPKVYLAQRFDRDWYYREIHRLHREDPDNRFVLIGTGTAADQLRQLAVQLANDGIALDTVAFLDPAGERTDLTSCPFPSLVIRSHHWRLSPRLQTSENLRVLNTRHTGLPHAPATVEQVLAIITASAIRVPISNPPIECVPEIDPKKPVPRPDQPKVIPALPPEWQLLCPPGK